MNFISADTWVFKTIFALVAIWLIGMTFVFLRLVSQYTLGKWTKDNPNPYAKETFAMPRGVFRGMLTLSLLYVFILFEVANLQIVGFEVEMEGLVVGFQMMLAFYFGSKVMHHVTSADRDKKVNITPGPGQNPGEGA